MVVKHQRGAEGAPAKKPATKRRKRKQAEPVAQKAAVAATEPQPTPEPTQEPQHATKPVVRKGKRAQADASITLIELAERYLQNLEAAGRSHGTLFSYGIELKTACRELGSDTLIASLTPDKVEAYFDSPRVTRLKSGKPKAKPSIDKTRRVLRLALVWAVEQRWISTTPIPGTAEPASETK